MLVLYNESPRPAALFAGVAFDQQTQLTWVGKTSYAFDAQGQLTECFPGEPIQVTDHYYANPLQSSLQYSAESVPFKQGSDVLLTGILEPPVPQISVCEVALQLRAANDDLLLDKTLCLFGERHWRRSFIGYHISKPAVLQALPLRYEYAYGGADMRKPQRVYQANPAGRGYTTTLFGNHLLPLPQIEQRPWFIRSVADQPLPAGFGPLPKAWQISLAKPKNNVESAAMQLPQDYYNSAPVDQRVTQKIQGGEKLIVKGFFQMAKNSAGLAIELPKFPGNLHSDAQKNTPQPQCDTVIIDITQKMLHLVWRAAFLQDWTTSKTEALIYR